MERGTGEPAGAQRDCRWCAVAVEVADPGQRPGRSLRDHGAAAWLGLPLSCGALAWHPAICDATLIRPLAAYGAAQIAALTPAALNAQLDQLVLSQPVPPADLGRYAIAVSLTLLPIPSYRRSATWPSRGWRRKTAPTAATHRMQRMAVLGSAGIAAAMLVPLAAGAYWFVPLVFGAGYRGAVPLLWILSPGAVFLACGQVTGDLLRGRNRPIIVAWAQGLAAIFTVVLLFALLPVVGVAGAAIASTVAYGVALAAMLRSLWRLPTKLMAGEILRRPRGHPGSYRGPYVHVAPSRCCRFPLGIVAG